MTISFLIQAKQHANNSEKFHKDLLENGAEFPATFSSNLHRIINNTGAEKRMNDNSIDVSISIYLIYLLKGLIFIIVNSQSFCEYSSQWETRHIFGTCKTKYCSRSISRYAGRANKINL
jgi:hypothetical protein